MAFAQFLCPLVSPSFQHSGADWPRSVSPLAPSLSRTASRFGFKRSHRKVRAEQQESSVSLAADALANIKHVLLPITDRNPYLSEGSRQAAATTASLAKKYGADITVLLTTNLKNLSQIMNLSCLAFGGIFQKVDSRNSDFWNVSEKKRSRLPSLARLLMTSISIW